MEISAKNIKYLHQKLPIGDDEKILGVYRHHWFAYASIWATGVVMVFVIIVLAIVLVSAGDSTGSLSGYHAAIITGAALLAVLVTVFTAIPVWLRSQEQVVLTEESVLQILQPSLLASKVSQLNLRHIADVSVRQDFFGTILNFGHISIETPGEQNDYQFNTIPAAHDAAKCIIEAHENYQAALESGRMPSTLGVAPPQPVSVDPEQYQQFLAYQKMVAMQKPAATADDTDASLAEQSTPQNSTNHNSTDNKS